MAINPWEAKPEFAKHRFEVYEPGVHHLAFHVEKREQEDEVCELVKGLGAEILDGPGEFPYEGPGGWYAVYFLGPDRMKFEVVHMPAAEKAFNEIMRTLERGAKSVGSLSPGTGENGAVFGAERGSFFSGRCARDSGIP